MKPEEAISFLEPMQVDQQHPQRWTDLGCGSGLFSRALATILPKHSRILCIDKIAQNQLTGNINGVNLEFIQSDFIDYDFGNSRFNGFLMANSLHYIRDKMSFLKRIVSSLEPDGSFIIIEYDTNKANPWVPYPLRFGELADLFRQIGMGRVEKFNERKSAFGSMMYACQVTA